MRDTTFTRGALPDPTPRLDRFTRAYLTAALWSTNDESDESGGVPFDQNYSIDDLAPDALDAAIRDCERFQAENEADIAEDDLQAGYDFWLTRNGHGCGFWDGDWPDEQGERLTEASKAFGELWPYIGDDGLIYGFGE